MQTLSRRIRVLRTAPKYSSYYTHPLVIPIDRNITSLHQIEPIWAETVNLRHIYAFRQAAAEASTRVAIVGDVINSDSVYTTQFIQSLIERNPGCRVTVHNECIGGKSWGELHDEHAYGFGPVIETISEEEDCRHMSDQFDRIATFLEARNEK